jgi:multidrug efflux system membrane fusion protein
VVTRPCDRSAHRFRILILWCLFVCIIGCGTSDKAGSGKKGPPPVLVSTAQAIRKDTPDFLHAVGTVKAFESVNIRPRVTGRLLKVDFTPGQAVRAGQLLFSIDPEPFHAKLRRAEANLKTAETELEHAQVDFRRYQTLLEEKMVTPEKFETVRVTLKSKENAVERQEADLKLARLNLDYCSIHSPITGQAGEILVDEGNTVSAYQDTLVNIKQIQPVKVEFSLPGKDLPEIRKRVAKEQLQVLAQIEGSSEPESGHLRLMHNTINSKTGMIMLQGLFPNTEERLWPGQFVRVRLKLGISKQAILVPTKAVGTGPKTQYVWVVGKDLSVKMIPVEISRRTEEMYVVSKGLEAGETVVTEGQLMLHPGAKAVTKAQMEELLKKNTGKKPAKKREK